MPDYNRLQVREVISIVLQAYPNAAPAYIMRLINDAYKESANRYKMGTKQKKINAVEDQAWYNLKDLDGTKITAVAFMNSDGEYVRIKRLLDDQKVIRET